MVQTPSDRLKSYWPANRPAVERPTVQVGQAETPQLAGWTEWLADCIGERPVLTLATAAVLGLALGWIVKRK